MLLLFHPLLRKVWNAFYRVPEHKRNGGEGRLDQRLSFDYAFAILYLVMLHGSSAFKVALILFANYRLVTSVPRKYIPLATWVFNITVLFSNELCRGYPYKDVAKYFVTPLVGWGAWLDSYSGLVPRWSVLFNITILRLVSFNMDYYWSLEKRGGNSLEVCFPALFSNVLDLICQRRNS